MRTRGSALVVRALEDAGARFTFGIPGTHNIELYDALAGSDRVTAILVTDEQSAGFMADAVSRSSSSVGVVNLVPGAGATHALSGIAEALLDGIPLVVLACGIRRDTNRAYQLHDIDQAALLRPVTKAVLAPATPSDLYGCVRQAFALATSGTPGPVAVEIPADYYLLTHDVPEPGGEPAATNAPAPAETDVRAAAALLMSARHPVIYAGYGARDAGPTLVELAETLGAPVATTIQGKGVFPEQHPLWVWNGLGRSAPSFAAEIGSSCDVMLALGCRFGEVGTGSWGFTPPPALVHVDINPDVFNRNFPARVTVASDAAAFVRALLDVLPDSREWGARTEHIAVGHRAVKEDWRRTASDDRVTPAWFFAALQRLMPEALFTTDSGNGTFLAMEHLRLNRPGRFLAPVDYSCMGYAVPAAIGAKLANPETDVVALAGDGALLMTGLEALTASAYGAAPIFCVLRDGELAQIAQFQRTALGGASNSVLPSYSVEGLAQAVNADYLSCANDGRVEAVLRDALAASRAGRPVFVEVAIDYTHKTYFTRGVVTTNFWRLPWSERLRMLGRAAGRHLSHRLEPDW
jgi:acetolactate synthase-1/2/3 large subunit